MGKATQPGNAKPYLLNRDAAMDEKLLEFGRQGLPLHAAAAQLDCCKDTLRAFFVREPACRQIYQTGLEAFRAQAASQKRAATQAYQAQPSLRPQPGEPCAYCGQSSAPSAEQFITLNVGELAQARAKLEKLLNRRRDAADLA